MTEINTHIAYSMGETVSSTSFVQTIDPVTRTQAFSVVTLPDKASAALYVSKMNLFDCRQIVRVYHQLDDNGKVAVEKLGMKFKVWLNYEFEKWESGGKKEPWWDYIKEKFTTLFGDAFIAVGEVHRIDKFCGTGLENNLAVYINERADGKQVVNCKLVNLNDCRDNEDSCALLEDTSQLSDMMSKVIYGPLQDSRNAPVGHVPMALTQLLRKLKSKDFVRFPSDAAWILDEPLFWREEQKKSFIRKLWHLILISDKRDVFSNAKVNAFLSRSICGWRFDIEVGTTFDRLKLRMMDNLRIYQEEKGMPVDYTLLDGFTGATGMYRQSLYHNEDKPASKIWGADVEKKVADFTSRMERSNDISSHIDRMIGKTGCLCSCLHAALLDHKNDVVGSKKIQMIATLEELSSDYEV